MAERAPKGLGTAGKRLWKALTGEFDLAEHERRLLIEACRVSDRLEELEDDIAAAETLTPKGKAHPALVEARQQQIVLARLIASLRIPDAEDEQPQRRGAARGTYGLRVVGE